MTKTKVELLTNIGNQISEEINKVTGAKTEVTIRSEVMIYTEELDKIKEIKNLMGEVRDFIKESFYEAEEDSAGTTLFYTL